MDGLLFWLHSTDNYRNKDERRYFMEKMARRCVVLDLFVIMIIGFILQEALIVDAAPCLFFWLIIFKFFWIYLLVGIALSGKLVSR